MNASDIQIVGAREAVVYGKSVRWFKGYRKNEAGAWVFVSNFTVSRSVPLENLWTVVAAKVEGRRWSANDPVSASA
jgi:hypothetical protein